jgi:hypothetical protein
MPRFAMAEPPRLPATPLRKPHPGLSPRRVDCFGCPFDCLLMSFTFVFSRLINGENSLVTKPQPPHPNPQPPNRPSQLNFSLCFQTNTSFQRCCITRATPPRSETGCRLQGVGHRCRVVGVKGQGLKLWPLGVETILPMAIVGCCATQRAKG